MPAANSYHEIWDAMLKWTSDGYQVMRLSDESDYGGTLYRLGYQQMQAARECHAHAGCRATFRLKKNSNQ
jgi:hypothetical protein